MDTKSLKCSINSISRFIHLVACRTVEFAIIEKDFVNMAGLLKLLKPVLDEVVDSAVCLDEKLVKELEDLDVVVNEAREFMEKWCPKMSKIYSVLHSEPLALKVQSSTLEIISILYRFFRSAPLTSHLSAIQKNMQEFLYPEQDLMSVVIEEALGDQRENLIPCAEHLIQIMKSLSLTSSQKLLTESVALEKVRVKAQSLKKKDESDLINQIIDLVSHIRDCTVELELFEAPKGPSVPTYFRCPLSLELMLDPVIVASGQTYEKAFIQKWLDHGLNICPKTRQTLTHTNLIPNYTVKALIANWCEDNNVRFSNSSMGSSNPPSLSSQSQNFNHLNNFSGSLNSSTSSSRSSHGVQNEQEKQRVDVSSGLSSRHSCVTESSIEAAPEFPASFPLNKNLTLSPSPSEENFHSSKPRVTMTENGNSNHHRSLSHPFTDLGSDDITASSHVKKLVEDLKSQSNEAQTAAAAELRLLAKHNKGNRVVIAQCGAIAPLVSLLHSMVKLTQEHAVTALLNLSINDENKVMIAEAGALEPLIIILKSGSEGAKENSAATLFSLSVLEQYKIQIGRSGAVKALIDLLGSGTLRGKKDAATALFNLSIFHENKARIVQAGAVKYLVKLMEDSGMADKVVALLANLAMISEGRSEITREGGIPLLVEVIEVGSQRGKENAASIILQLCISSHKFCSLVLQEGAVPPLVALSQSGTPRAKEKAQQILSHFRDRREGANGKAKS